MYTCWLDILPRLVLTEARTSLVPPSISTISSTLPSATLPSRLSRRVRGGPGSALAWPPFFAQRVLLVWPGARACDPKAFAVVFAS